MKLNGNLTTKLKSILTILISGGLLGITTATLAADAPQTGIPMSTIITNLQNKGYPIIFEIKYEDGAYKVESRDSQDKKVDLTINPQNGLVSTSKEATPHISMLDAAKKVEAAGYRSIYKVSADGDKYEMKAVDKDNKKVDLTINARTGEISKDWF